MDCVNGSISSSEVSASPRKAKELIKTLPGSDSSKTINVAVSSRALFDLEEENDLFVKKGLEDYIALQVRREDDMLKPGSAFPFIKIWKLREKDPKEQEIFSIVLMSHNNARVGIRLQKSIDHNGNCQIVTLAI
ncbi:cytosolic 5'-nucleotidase 1A isoform X2 [Nematostella vectensis]|uniref:cytosolic 5'-nucleotidase 1A isoform X2 n=1 Tax=Nematostella vectensis TaxID=45351 RepID=UPI002076E1A4|nr:cytosolic 5'-nucleotidase 1A isoform X2 [Nematostella vectensis]